MFEYNIENIRIIDGDTIEADIDLGFNIKLQNRKIRLYAIDAPDIYGRNKTSEEYALGKEAAKVLDEWLLGLNEGDSVSMKTIKDKTGKYGRIIGKLYVHYKDRNDVWTTFDVNNELIDAGLAKRMRK